MVDLPTVYLETTIPSYLAARPSRDVIALARQQLTRTWWDVERKSYRVFISRVVLEEIAAGDPEAASERLALVSGLAVLEITPEVAELASWYTAEIPLPAQAAADAIHLAVAVGHSMDSLLTWNCAHLANAEVRRRLRRLNTKRGIHIPTICTPEELVQWNA